jgi:two-component system NarL family sensor kinase
LNDCGQPAAGEPANAVAPGSRSFWSDAYGSLPIETRAREQALILIQLENSLLLRLVRLQAIESRLWRAVSARRGRAGRRALRQIERERQRLGRELHTGVGQLLAAIRIQLEVISTHLPAPAPPVAQALERIGALAAESLDQVRGVSRRLHPPEWQRLQLPDAVRQLWDTSGIAQRFAGSVQAPPLPCDPDPDIKTLFYRATQEALSNIIRHAKATRVDLGLSHSAGRLRLTVQDDGVGFDTARALAARPDIAAGIGLRSIREQAADLGGNLLVDSGPLGTTLEVSIPLEC